MVAQLALFADPVQPGARRPPEPIIRGALIEGNYRRWLYRGWGSGPCIFWGMSNPSDAGAERDDPTLWRIMGFSYRWGFGSLYVANESPFISASPGAARRWRSSWSPDAADPDWSARDAWVRNCYDAAETAGKCDFHMAAWGNCSDPADLALWLEHVELEAKKPIDWHCLGVTVSGAPKHPLARGHHRVPDDVRPLPWRPSHFVNPLGRGSP